MRGTPAWEPRRAAPRGIPARGRARRGPTAVEGRTTINAAGFAEAYATVEQDHELVLDQVQTLREMVLALTAPEGIDAPAVFARLRELDK